MAVKLHTEAVGEPFVEASLNSILANADYLESTAPQQQRQCQYTLQHGQTALIWADTGHNGDCDIARTIQSNLCRELPLSQHEHLELVGPTHSVFHGRNTASYSATSICDELLGSSDSSDSATDANTSLLLVYLTERTLALPETVQLIEVARQRKSWSVIVLQEMDGRADFGKVSDATLRSHSGWNQLQPKPTIVPYFKEKIFRLASMTRVLQLWLQQWLRALLLQPTVVFSVAT